MVQRRRARAMDAPCLSAAIRVRPSWKEGTPSSTVVRSTDLIPPDSLNVDGLCKGIWFGLWNLRRVEPSKPRFGSFRSSPRFGFLSTVTEPCRVWFLAPLANRILAQLCGVVDPAKDPPTPCYFLAPITNLVQPHRALPRAMRSKSRQGALPNLLYGPNKLMFVAIATLGSAMAAAGAGAGMAAGGPVKRHTIFHAFNWRLGSVVHRLGHMQEMGYDAVQISPVQKSVGDEWWARYQPTSFSAIEGLGSKDELKDLCARAGTKGIMVVADLVFNHMAVLPSPRDSSLYLRTHNFS